MNGRTQSYGRHRALILCESVFLPPYASSEWMWTLITWFSREICSPLTGGPNGGRTQKSGCHRALILCGACSSLHTHLLSDVDSYNMVFQGDMLSSNRGTYGGRNSEVRCHRALILCEACSSRPYASFEWMWTPITWFSREICSPLTGGPMSAVTQKSRCS